MKPRGAKFLFIKEKTVIEESMRMGVWDEKNAGRKVVCQACVFCCTKCENKISLMKNNKFFFKELWAVARKKLEWWVETRRVCSKVISAFQISLEKYLYYKIFCFRKPIAPRLNRKYIVLIIVVLNLISIANTIQVGGRLMQNEYHIFYSVSPENQQIYLV